MALLLLAIISPGLAKFPQAALPKAAGKQAGNAKWIRISGNMLTANPQNILSVVRRAKDAGANGVVISDVKLLTWWFRSPGAKWLSNAKEIRKGIRDLDMAFILAGEGLGYCHGPVSKDVNLAAGYPMKEVPLVVSSDGGTLLPVETAQIPNGSFEDADGDTPVDWGFQDFIGTSTFVDTKVSHTGKKSLRFEPTPKRSTRIFNAFAVKPFQQYTFSVWVKASKLQTDNVRVLIRDEETDASRSKQHLSLPDGNGGRAYFTSLRGQSFDWAEMRIAFNSLSSTRIGVVLGVWTGNGGKIWWDDARVAATPTLNLLRRKTLPFSLRVEGSGRVLKEGRDFEAVRDAKLGQTKYAGNYDTYHKGPVIKLKRSAKLSAGDMVFLNGFHTLVTTGGQIGCSWSDKKVLDIVRKTYERNEEMFAPDAYFRDHNEVRTGGWEPREVKEKSSGRAFAKYMGKETKAILKVTQRHKPLYVWSDMFDKHHNGVDGYADTHGSFDGSWKGVDTRKVVIVNWNGNKNVETGRKSFGFFKQLGFTQIASAFYDNDVVRNRKLWKDIVKGNGNNIGGSMYTTWVDGPYNFHGDFSQIERFGKLWW